MMIGLLKDEISTTDTPLAAHLITEGFPLKDIIFEGAIAHWVFTKNNNHIEEYIHDFELLNAKSSNASRLIENFRQLISRSKKGY